ncbi:ABC transporter permease [Cohnella sp. LGH]|uniref:ABC transporter permease n=1 Tax=Cohnella sp. LGH TaxID=1619153 RepID=UPI001AD9CF5D|nr:ABC transporter permease [Cohnella sp. LGH]QTH41400.1 ABC transporter permease [Cohnella sp. LGH]
MIRKIQKLWPFAAAVATLLLLLQVGNWVNPLIFPSVPSVFVRLYEGVAEPKFWKAVGASMYRLLIGYPIACFLGGIFGLLAGLYRGFASYLRRLIAILQSIPPITWLPFLMIIYGFGDVPIIAIVIIASFFPMAIAVMDGTEGVVRTHLEVARVLGAKKSQIVRRVYLPETLPAFMTGGQLAFGNAWRSLIAGEMFGSAMVGLGFSIRFAGEIADMSGVILYIIVIGVIATLLDQILMEQVKRRLLRWRYIAGGEGN